MTAESPGEHPDSRPHHRYTVTLCGRLGRDPKTIRVLTNRGEIKAAYLAAIATKTFLSRQALNIQIKDDGLVELDPQGLPVMDGYVFDRDEW